MLAETPRRLRKNLTVTPSLGEDPVVIIGKIPDGGILQQFAHPFTSNTWICIGAILGILVLFGSVLSCCFYRSSSLTQTVQILFGQVKDTEKVVLKQEQEKMPELEYEIKEEHEENLKKYRLRTIHLFAK